jgi:hypothetical protein
MRKFVTLAALLVASSIPSAASAQFFLGARLGYGIPWGDIETSWPVKDSLKSQIPIQVDAGLKLGQALAIGGYAGIGIGQPSNGWQDDCDFYNSTCSATDFRFGAQVNLHAANTETTEFWGGVGLGYEQLRFKDSKGLITQLTFKGVEATLQGGFDFLLSPSFRFGPFASLSVGQFTNWATKTDSGKITDKELHGFLTIGVRGMFGG